VKPVARPFDLDQRLAALRHPAFTWHGRTYTGRPVSWEQLLAWGERFDALARRAEAKDVAGIETDIAVLAAEMTEALFPDAPVAPPPPWWRRWTVAAPAPRAVDVVAALPAGPQFELLASFFVALTTTMPQAAGPTTTAATTPTPEGLAVASPT
jgi:hypothetical protein